MLGAALALAGGLIAQGVQHMRQRRDEERGALLEALDELLTLTARLAVFDFRDISDDESVSVQDRLQVAQHCLRLHQIAIRLASSEHRGVGVRILRLALDSSARTSDYLMSTAEEVQLRLNRKLIDEYQRSRA